ncbi:MAG: GlsB/YeaQ/YmgE family stress response membrane protein [Proteobacteria bacterium]|nr:GlsB/YeaQ/YmgE family stress response membrane protein [Pseudomonadota bacterium]
MVVLYTILIGFFIGLIARALKPGDDRMGILATTAFGIGGALIAQYIGHTMGWYHDNDPLAFITAVAGSIVLLTIYAMAKPKRKR